MAPLTFDYVQLSVGYILFQYLPSFNSVALLLLQLFGIRYYVMHGERELLRRVVKLLSAECYSCSYKHLNGKEIPSGYFFCKEYIGYLDNNARFNEDERIHIICRKETYQRLVEERTVADSFAIEPELKETEISPLIEQDKGSKSPSKTESSKIRAYIRKGQFKNLYYSCIKLDLSHINPIGEQGPIVEDIIKIYKKKRRAVAFIHGVSFAGKSSIGFLLAKRLKGNYCHSFNPTDPGDNFASVINELTDDEESPIIIVLEEVDGIIKAVHNETIKSNPEIPTSVRNKESWVNFLDDMMFYKNVIVVLTSNTEKKDLDMLDEAYLRKGRIHGYYSMMNKLSIEDSIDEEKEKLN